MGGERRFPGVPKYKGITPESRGKRHVAPDEAILFKLRTYLEPDTTVDDGQI